MKNTEIISQNAGFPSINSSHHISPMAKLLGKIKAYFIAKDVKSALKEVEMIEAGKKKAKSLDQLLDEL
jgi:hypothetical protein